MNSGGLATSSSAPLGRVITAAGMGGDPAGSAAAAQAAAIADAATKYVPLPRTVNGKPLSGNITLNASDVGADSSGAAAAAGAAAVAAAEADAATKYVPLTRTVNGVLLSSDAILPIGDAYAKVWNVGKSPGMYATVADAVAAINAFAVAPSASGRYAIMVWPGFYASTAPVTIPSFVGVVGLSKGLVQFSNATTNIFTCSDNTWFENFLVEGAANAAIYAFEGNNASGVHVRNVDMLNNGGTATQGFIHQTGATWHTWFVERSVQDSFRASGYVNYFANTAGGAARQLDVEINDVFCDTYHLTGYGGGFELISAHDIRFRNCKIRGGDQAGGSTHQTGIRHEAGTATGTKNIEIFASYLAGGVPIYGEAGTDYTLMNSDAVGSLTAGTRTMRNSSV